MNAHPVQPSKRTIEGLESEGPNPELEEKLMLFGRFVGDWDILEDRFYPPDATRGLERNFERGASLGMDS